MPVVARYQDKSWSQIPDQAGRVGNYPEASASALFVYALAKGVWMDYLPDSMLPNARRGYAAVLKTFIGRAPDGRLALKGTISVGGLGGIPYHDGSYDYYLSEPIGKNDLKGIGPFIMASVELRIADEPSRGRNNDGYAAGTHRADAQKCRGLCGRWHRYAQRNRAAQLY